jgi:hypothetical protein
MSGRVPTDTGALDNATLLPASSSAGSRLRIENKERTGYSFPSPPQAASANGSVSRPAHDSGAGYVKYRPVTADGEVFGPTQTVASPNAKAVAMRRLLPLAALVFALWAIDAYAFHSRYWAAASEDVDYYAKILNDGVHGLMRRLNP